MICCKIIVWGDIMLYDIIKKMQLPKLKTREEMLEILQREEYGFMPPKPESLTFEEENDVVLNFCAGKAVCNRITANVVVNGKEFSFPFYAVMPTENGKHPFCVHINFRGDLVDRYQPVEEIVDNGFALFSFDYKDITSDDNDMTNGFSGVLYPDGKRGPNDAGKIAMWAWAAQRVMDYAYTKADVLDLENCAVCGHSRLGKTALVTAATDERFKFAYSNNSGNSGAAIARDNTGETIEVISRVFPHWFCENYRKYADNEYSMPFDQHYLIASIAPRKVLIGSASEDDWANPLGEMLSCVAASDAFENGFKFENRPPEIDDCFFEGDIGYHMRKGLHYFSRKDWQRLMEFMKKHKN